MMNVFGWILIGVAAGCISTGARVNKRGESLVLDVLMSVGGAMVGGYLFTAFRTAVVTGFDAWSLVFAALGAAIALVIWRGMRGSAARI